VAQSCLLARSARAADLTKFLPCLAEETVSKDDVISVAFFFLGGEGGRLKLTRRFAY